MKNKKSDIERVKIKKLLEKEKRIAKYKDQLEQRKKRRAEYSEQIEQRKKRIAEYQRDLTKVYEDTFLNYFSKGIFINYYNSFDETFLQYFDLKKFIQIFDKRIGLFCEDVKFKLDDDKSYNLYAGLIYNIINEVIESIFYKYNKLNPSDLGISGKEYKREIILRVKELNNELLLGKSKHPDFKKPLMITPELYNILDNVLGKYEFIFAVASKRFKDAEVIFEKQKNELVEKNKEQYILRITKENPEYKLFLFAQFKYFEKIKEISKRKYELKDALTDANKDEECHLHSEKYFYNIIPGLYIRFRNWKTNYKTFFPEWRQLFQ
ncbi:MAG: hypothetical protein NTX22_06590 [Ignavibacteriales bacterium]|nr:hypothetical protein [Ignavibacteriales bacterium]